MERFKQSSKIKMNTKKRPLLNKLLQVLLWIILLIIGFIANDVYDKYTAKPSINILMPISPNENGEFPITISNNGKVDLEIKKVKIQSCYMEDNEWVYRYPDDLPSGDKTIVNFLDEETYNKSQIIDCVNNPLKNWEDRTMNATICKDINSGEIFVPKYNNSFFMCGFCHWNITIETNKGVFPFFEEMYLPAEYIFEIIPQTKPNNLTNSSNIICSNGFKVTYFEKRELEIIGEYD